MPGILGTEIANDFQKMDGILNYSHLIIIFLVEVLKKIKLVYPKNKKIFLFVLCLSL